MLNSHTSKIAPIPIAIARLMSKLAPASAHVESENHSAWIRVPTTRPLIASTLDHANQYPKVAIGPTKVKYLRHASWANSAIPPGLLGNIVASSA